MEYHHSTNRTQVRKDLLHNGFVPLPLTDKGCYIEGWSRAEIDEDWLKPHERVGRYVNTGLRCDELLAFDIDVLDEDLADACEALIEREAGETDFCRIGQWPKRLLLYRGIGTRSGRTGKYGGHMVELLATHGRQFAAYGTHPRTGDYYAWEGLHPAIAKASKIPGLTFDAAESILNQLDELLAATGLPLERRAHTRGAAGEAEYDLLDDTLVEYEGTRLRWGDLKGDLSTEGGFGNLYRAEYDDWGDSSAVHFMLSFNAKEPCAHDFVNDCTHYSAFPFDQLGALLPPLPAQDDPFVPDGIVELYDNCVILPDGNGAVRYLSDPTRANTLSGFRQTIKHLRQPAPTRANPNRTVEVFEAWLQDRKALRAMYAEFRPDLTPGIHDKVLNTYRPPAHDAKGGSTDVFWEFMEHLIPDDDERMLVDGWLANKVQHPHHRQHGLMMVADDLHGTGRGTLFGIISRLFGEAYVNEAELGDITGQSGGQSTFNAYLADSLIVTVGEALEEKEDAGRWHIRKTAFERLKRVVDTTTTRMQIKRKYGANTQETIYASLLIATNHADCLAIPPGDRRLIIVENGTVTLDDAPNGLRDRIDEWAQRDENIAALHAELLVPAQSYDPFGQPPMTRAKERMTELAQSDLDKLWDIWLEVAKGDICTMAQWRRFANQNAHAYELQLPPTPEKRDQGLVAILQRKCRRLEGLPQSGMKVKGNPVRPWIMRNVPKWQDSERAKVRTEILKNGDPGGAVVELPDID